KDEDVPVYPTIASQFNDPGITWMFANLCRLLREKLGEARNREQGTGNSGSGQSDTPSVRPEGSKDEQSGARSSFDPSGRTGGEAAANDANTTTRGLGSPRCDFSPHVEIATKEPRATILIPGHRTRYLAEIAEQGRAINTGIDHMADAASKAQSCYEALQELGDKALPQPLHPYPPEALRNASPSAGASHGRDR